MIRIYNIIDRQFVRLTILVIKIYRLILSPWIGQSCRFSPTCSAYTQEALKKHGFAKGIILGLRRIFRCHPWTKGSYYDPVP